MKLRQKHAVIAAVTVATQQLLFRQQQGQPFWFTLLPDSQTVYVNWRTYRGLGDNARRLFAFVDSVKAKRLVIDLGRLFVLTARRTYSAAVLDWILSQRVTPRE